MESINGQDILPDSIGVADSTVVDSVIVLAPDTLAQKSGVPDSARIRPMVRSKKERDTVAAMTYITPGSFYGEILSIHDTLTGKFHQYDPTKNSDYPYATLGNLGSAARSMYFDMARPKGLHIGHTAYDIYKAEFDAFRFYDTQVALTRFYYSQGISQQDGIFNAQFGKNFDKGINFSINYQRINQRGQFESQRAKNTAFGVGIMYRAPSGRLDGIYHYMSNSIVSEDNGGVEDLIALDTLDLRLNVPVVLNGALTTHRTRELTAQHHLHLLNSNESNPARKANVDLIHTFRYSNQFVKFADSNLGSIEIDYYGPFVTDDRGIRNYVGLQMIDNSLDVQFRYLNKSPEVPAQILRAGIQYRSSNVDQEPIESRVNEMFLNVAGQIGFSKHISVDGRGYIGILDMAGDYFLDANARISLFKDARTWAQLVLYQRSPNLTESRTFVNQLPVWDTNYDNINLSSVYFHYVHPSLQLELHAGAHLLSNYIYYDASRYAVQLDNTVELLQISAAKEITLGPLGAYARLMLQQYDVDEVALPHLIFNGQLFYTGRWFKQRLLVRTGFDLLITDSYQGVSYFPVTGQFHYDPAFQIDQYPAVDFYFSMQVKDFFKAFAKFENITAFVSDENYIQIEGYPQFARYFRFGLWMRLFD